MSKIDVCRLNFISFTEIKQVTTIKTDLSNPVTTTISHVNDKDQTHTAVLRGQKVNL